MDTTLCCDIGNTSLHFGLFQTNKLLWEEKLPVSKALNFPQWWRKNSPCANVNLAAISSVNPKITLVVKNFIKEISNSLWEVGKDLPIPIKARVDVPEEVGLDRLINAWAAYQKYQQASLVIDFGTAITFDVVSQQGEYLGGVIAPGIQLAAKTLCQNTALLPLVQPKPLPHVIGKNTQQCIQSALFWGNLGMVEFLIQKIQEELTTPLLVIATGGDSLWIAKHSPLIQKIQPTLTLMGIFQLTQTLPHKKLNH